MKDIMAAIGARIRVRRQSCGMTQQALAEGIVTRNMLSQIENGTALPSVRTLEEFAKKLDVTAGWLLSGGGDELFNARQAFTVGDNETAIELALAAPESAERQLLCCQAYCRVAEAAMSLGNTESAKEHAQMCLSFCGGVYDDVESRLTALRIIAICDLLSGNGEAAVTTFHTAHAAEGIETKHNLVMARYFLEQENLAAAERAIWSITAVPDIQKGIYLLIRGRLALKQEKYDAAAAYLRQAKTHGVPPPFSEELAAALAQAEQNTTENE